MREILSLTLLLYENIISARQPFEVLAIAELPTMVRYRYRSRCGPGSIKLLPEPGNGHERDRERERRHGRRPHSCAHTALLGYFIVVGLIFCFPQASAIRSTVSNYRTTGRVSHLCIIVTRMGQQQSNPTRVPSLTEMYNPVMGQLPTPPQKIAILPENQTPVEDESTGSKIKTSDISTDSESAEDAYEMDNLEELANPASESNRVSTRFICGVCFKSFRWKSHLKRHLYVHAIDTRPHICEVCGWSFAEKGNLKTHIRTHRMNVEDVSEIKIKNIVEGMGQDGGALDWIKRENAVDDVMPQEVFKREKCTQSASHSSLNLKMRDTNFMTKNNSRKSSLQKINETSYSFSHHKCNICGITFEDPTNLLAHMSYHTTTKKQTPHWFRCTKCKETYNDAESLIQHSITVHINTHTCKICGKTYTDPMELTDHIALHTSAEFSRCKVCGEVYPDPKVLARHVSAHGVNIKLTTDKETGLEIFRCRMCDVVVPEGKYFSEHVYKHTHMLRCGTCRQTFPSRPVNPSCPHCGNTAKNPRSGISLTTKDVSESNTITNETSDVVVLNGEHHGDDTDKHMFRCGGCRQTFSARPDNASCPHCGNTSKNPRSGISFKDKSASSSGASDKNTTTNSQKKPRKNRGAPNFYKYTSWLRTAVSNGAKPHCWVCNKDFRSRAHLIRHVRTHTKEQPYECRFCHQRFGRIESQRRHEKIHNRKRSNGKVIITIQTGSMEESTELTGKVTGGEPNFQSKDEDAADTSTAKDVDATNQIPSDGPNTQNGDMVSDNKTAQDSRTISAQDKDDVDQNISD